VSNIQVFLGRNFLAPMEYISTRNYFFQVLVGIVSWLGLFLIWKILIVFRNFVTFEF
jgi:hypothetical protein